MDQEMKEQLAATAGRLGKCSRNSRSRFGRLDAQQEALNAKVDRIVAAVEERETKRRKRFQ